MRSIKTHLTAALLLCILLPTGLLGGMACWFVYNLIEENRIGDVGPIADTRHEEMRAWLNEAEALSQDLLNIWIEGCRHSDAGANACTLSKNEEITHSV